MIVISPLFLKSRMHRTSSSVLARFIPSAIVAIWAIPQIVSAIPSKVLGSASTLVDRQAAGLSGNNSGVTPAFVHFSQTWEAFVQAFKSVFGYGTGSISGAQRLNGLARMNFETDIGNAAYAFGIVGFIIMMTIFYGLYSAISNSPLSEASLLVLLLLPSINNWFNPGHYSTVWVTWLLIGNLLGQKLQEQHGKT
jgi:hypothetical protein